MSKLYSIFHSMGNTSTRSSPFELMMKAKREEIQSKRCIPGKASDFYFFCHDGKLDCVRQILDAPDSPSIETLNALQPNGSTALHAAVFYNHIEIVKILLERKCPQTTLNRFGNIAYDESKTTEMRQLFNRSDASERFHDTNTTHSREMYVASEHYDNTSTNVRFDYVHEFQSDNEISEHLINQQTLAMWLKFYTWFTKKFRNYLERDEYHIDAFDLDKHADFQVFLQHNVSNSNNYQFTMNLISEAQNSNSLEPLIKLYTSEEANMYNSLNKHLASSSTDSHMGPHLCDRFVMEFFMRRDELKRRAYTGIAYRGITLSINELDIYKRAVRNEAQGVLNFKSFTSVSRDPMIALQFATKYPPKENEKTVLFVFEIYAATPTVFSIEDISYFPHEREVLILPGSLFIIDSVEDNLSMNITTIHLTHWEVPVRFLTKIHQTFRCAKRSFLS